ncbi:PHD family toxin-antitoxin system [Lactobacillus kimbladii]|uniref:PHD family toxin-antitoxin system n=1 Tax=Lactobacillus kimbladii TaxID=1218506 RepID=A0A0F4LLH7_9LACO|nr:hypothetical protein [Lactobacillus kimbladii]KJY59134.1 PHD family toxin-antitoxin system [Lactobacillus kimbladii]
MVLAITQGDFRSYMKKYLDAVSNNETVYVARSHNRTVALISQEKLLAMEQYITAPKDSTEYDAAKVKLVELGMIPATTKVKGRK